MTRFRCVADWLLKRWYVVLALSVSVALIIVAWTWAGDQAQERKDRGDRIVRQNEAIARQADALIAQNDRVVDCTTPGRKCYEDAQARSGQLLGRAFAEIDCTTRRALAGLPAPDPTKGTCAVQTPPSVYPGAP